MVVWRTIYYEITMLYPFRVGCGLVQRIVSEQLAMQADYVLDWRDVDPHAWCDACQAVAMGNLTALTAISVKVVSETWENE